MSAGWAGGSTRAWRALRVTVLARDAFECKLQTDRCTLVATCVHHLRGKAYGDDPEYLVAACEPCNLKVGDPGRQADPPNVAVTDWTGVGT